MSITKCVPRVFCLSTRTLTLQLEGKTLFREIIGIRNCEVENNGNPFSDEVCCALVTQQGTEIIAEQLQTPSHFPKGKLYILESYVRYPIINCQSKNGEPWGSEVFFDGEKLLSYEG